MPVSGADITRGRHRVLRKDRTFFEAFQENIFENGPVWIFTIAGVMFLYPQLFELWLLTALFIFWIHGKRPYPEIPSAPKLTKQFSGAPLFCPGIDMNLKQPVWLSDTQMRQHMLVMGTTGAGKTEFLLNLIAQAMAMGGGAIFVDGKADVKTWVRLYSIAKRLGVEENLRVLNFGLFLGNDLSAADLGAAKYDLSNTMNPFTLGDANQLAEMMASLMAEAGGDGAMWKGRAEAMMRALLTALVDLRNAGVLLLGPSVISEYMPLDRLASLENDSRLTPLARSEIKRYLDSVAGFRAGGQGKVEADKQHGFLVMQFTEILGLLNNAYGHIMDSKLGEIDFYDIIVNRRILYVMLPAMEKSGNSIKNLGKIVVNQVRAALSKTLSAGVKGTLAEKLQARPTNSETPMLCVLDEYGSYAVEGFGEVAAQARSIGVSTIFAVQDWASLEKADSRGNEALRIWANTNTKVFMKVEDSKSTMPLILERVGEGFVLQSSGKESNDDSLLGSERMQRTSGYHSVKRVDPQELFRFKNGMCYIVTEDRFHKVQSTFLHDAKGNWANTEYFAPMRLIPVPAPTKDSIRKLLDAQSRWFNQGAAQDGPVDPEELAHIADFFRTAASTAKTSFPEDPMRAGLDTLRGFISECLLDSAREARRLFSPPQETETAQTTAAPAPWDMPDETDEDPEDLFEDDIDDLDDDGFSDSDEAPYPEDVTVEPAEKKTYVKTAREILASQGKDNLGARLDRWLREADEDETDDEDGAL